MRAKLDQIKAEALEQINNSDTLEKLNDVRVNVLGKKGALTAVLKSMKDVAPEDRPKVGQMVNDVRVEIENYLEEAKLNFQNYLLHLIPPELLKLYFFDGEKIADFFMEEGSNTRIKEAFLLMYHKTSVVLFL